MQEDAAESALFATGLTYEESLPLSWRALDAALTQSHLEHNNEANEAVLYTIAALEEHRPESHDLQHSQELARLEFKLNLLLDLVGQLIAQSVSLPTAVAVKLGAHAIAWKMPLPGSPPPVGSDVLVSVYLHRSYPRPLSLPGKLAAAGRCGDAWRLMVSLEGLSESVQDLLEKLIFRHHRRSIAYTRHSSS